MFISSAEKQSLNTRLVALEQAVLELLEANKRLYAKAPYGTCKDGTPRAKPGMKTGQKKGVRK